MHWGQGMGLSMSDSKWQERRDQIARYRALDLLHAIVLEWDPSTLAEQLLPWIL
jgi:hypothetical protein